MTARRMAAGLARGWGGGKGGRWGYSFLDLIVTATLWDVFADCKSHLNMPGRDQKIVLRTLLVPSTSSNISSLEGSRPFA